MLMKLSVNKTELPSDDLRVMTLQSYGFTTKSSDTPGVVDITDAEPELDLTTVEQLQNISNQLMAAATFTPGDNRLHLVLE